MQINSINPSQNYSTNQPSFKRGLSPQVKQNLQKGFDWLGDKCNVENGSLTREMFLAVSFLFLLGARFIEARDNDERREILTRDIPAIAVSGVGALLLNNPVGRLITKKSGIPISFKDGKALNFATQKQVKDWYSNLSTMKNPLETLSEMVERNGGNIQKVMKKFGFENEMKAISDSTKNVDVIAAIKDAKNNKPAAFEALENLLKNVKADNKVVKFAKSSQAAVKLSCLAVTAAFLGYFLPRLNIIITKKKVQESQPAANPQSPSGGVEANVMKISNYHSTNAAQSFKNFLNMVNK